MKKISLILFSFIMCISVYLTAGASQAVSDTADYLINTVTSPSVGSIGGEWTVIGLARSGVEVPDGYFENYYTNVVNYVVSRDGVVHSRKNTEYSRIIIALNAIGKNPENVSGYNLVDAINDYDSTVRQGINGAVWAIIALDSGNYSTEDIRERYISYIMSREKSGGGWALSDSDDQAEADVTAMVIIALSKYMDRPDIKNAVDRAVGVLSEMQNENGSYFAYNTEASESTAQVLTALSSIGISHTDSRFVKNGLSLIDNILTFKNSDGSFSHTDKGDIMATEQCFYALVASERLGNGKNPLFDMSDVKKTSDEKTGLSGKHKDVNVPDVMYENKTFDDIWGNKNQKSIEMLAQRGIINGKSEKVFEPDSTMTRAEFATITIRALGLLPDDTMRFDDVKNDSWYFQFVNSAYRYGIVNGVSETRFDPDGLITREQACVMVSSAAMLCGFTISYDDVTLRNSLSEFTDYMTVSDWAKNGVAFCFDNNITDRSVTEIQPSVPVTRGEVSDMLYNLLRGAGLI